MLFRSGIDCETLVCSDERKASPRHFSVDIFPLRVGVPDMRANHILSSRSPVHISCFRGCFLICLLCHEVMLFRSILPKRRVIVEVWQRPSRCRQTRPTLLTSRLKLASISLIVTYWLCCQDAMVMAFGGFANAICRQQERKKALTKQID